MTMSVERATQALNGIARTMRTRPSLAPLRAQSFAIEDGVKILAAEIDRLRSANADQAGELEEARARAASQPETAAQPSAVPLVSPEVSGQGTKVRNDARDTARAAALAALPQAGQNRRRVLDAIADPTDPAPGLTDREIAQMTGLPENSVRPRRVELVEGGWIEDSGTRRDHGGRMPWAVWVLTAKGRDQYVR